jgi:hypothetical protein
VKEEGELPTVLVLPLMIAARTPRASQISPSIFPRFSALPARASLNLGAYARSLYRLT